MIDRSPGSVTEWPVTRGPAAPPPAEEDDYVAEIFDAPETEATRAAGSVAWPRTDRGSPCYNHLIMDGSDLLSEAKTFEIGKAEFELLIAANRYKPVGKNDIIAFGLRGCRLRGEQSFEEVEKLPLEDTRPNHRDFRCVIGYYFRATGKFCAYTASTVPWHEYISKGMRCNTLPPGCYPYKVGTHRPATQSRWVKPALRLSDADGSESGPATVLRTKRDFVFGIDDEWDLCNPSDNVHTAYSTAKFSSLGCQTIKGGMSDGLWGDFAATLEELPEGSRVDYVLITGAECSIAATLVKAGKGAADPEAQRRLGRLRSGSESEEVKRLQAKLGETVTGYFGAATKKKLTDIQRANGAPVDGIYSPALDAKLKWGVFEGATSQPQAVAAAAPPAAPAPGAPPAPAPGPFGAPPPTAAPTPTAPPIAVATARPASAESTTPGAPSVAVPAAAAAAAISPATLAAIQALAAQQSGAQPAAPAPATETTAPAPAPAAPSPAAPSFAAPLPAPPPATVAAPAPDPSPEAPGLVQPTATQPPPPPPPPAQTAAVAPTPAAPPPVAPAPVAPAPAATPAAPPPAAETPPTPVATPAAPTPAINTPPVAAPAPTTPPVTTPPVTTPPVTTPPVTTPPVTTPPTTPAAAPTITGIRITAEDIREFAPTCKPEYAAAMGSPEGNDFLEKFGINANPRRLCHFMAQVHHESGGFKATEENLRYSAGRIVQIFGPGRHSAAIGSGEAAGLAGNPPKFAERVYGLGNPRMARMLGNTEPGDGYRYRGRGFIQLTGRGNYRRIGQRIGVDLEGDPDKAAQPVYALATAAAFWDSKNLNTDADRNSIEAITKKVNGGQVGIAHRRQAFSEAWDIWGEAERTRRGAAGTRSARGAPPPLVGTREVGAARPQLQYGDVSPDVVQLKQLLSLAGYGPLGTSEEFDRDTHLAAVRFQLDHGLPAEGVVGNDTWDALERGARTAGTTRSRAPGGAAPKDTSSGTILGHGRTVWIWGLIIFFMTIAAVIARLFADGGAKPPVTTKDWIDVWYTWPVGILSVVLMLNGASIVRAVRRRSAAPATAPAGGGEINETIRPVVNTGEE